MVTSKLWDEPLPKEREYSPIKVSLFEVSLFKLRVTSSPLQTSVADAVISMS